MSDTNGSDTRSSSSSRGRPVWQRLLNLGRGERSAEERRALSLPPMTRGSLAFAMLIFFLLGSALTTFLLLNPLGLPFLPARTATEAPRATGAATETAGTLYQCPMHPDVIESKPADCPICGMKLVAMESTSGTDERAAGGDSRDSETGREILYWYAPMDPTYVRDAPGLSPMGMKLVPKYAEDQHGDEEGVVRIDPVQVQNIGVVSEVAQREDIARTSRTVGILDFNTEKITRINTKFGGWIEEVHVSYVGQQVRKGEPLFEIYSPELVTTQQEYLRALEYKASLETSGRPETLRQAESLLQSTRQRLSYWDITEAQIEALTSSRAVTRRLTVVSPANGVVTKLVDQALKGMFVKSGMDLYEIADLATVWVHADVYESDLPWIRAGQMATVSFPFDPQRAHQGRVLFLYPEVSEDTRTLKICIELPNRDRQLRPGMYADVVIEGPPVRDATVISNSAILRSGARNLVFIDLGAGRFAPREVSVGLKDERDRVQILSGVEPGEAVVTQAQFMLDSESRIQEAIAKYRTRGTAPTERNGPREPSSQSHRHGS